ncbi:MAG: hypothetical protein ACOX61_07915 [Brooklawnia sp.]
MKQPFGFASPVAPPLSVAAEPSRLPSNDVPPPVDYAAPDRPAPALAEIAPAPPQHRDPRAPFVEAAPQYRADSDWQPHQPLPTSDTTTALATEPAQVDPATLPPPTGAPAGAQPTTHPMFGANPYATGPYSAPTPYGPPPNAAPKAPPNFQQLLSAANPWVLGLLGAGVLWPDVAALTLAAAGVTALVRKSPGSGLLIAAVALCAAITLAWLQGYFGPSQWQSSAQLLSFVCLVGVPLVTYQHLRR